jgi:hypothetical protein
LLVTPLLSVVRLGKGRSLEFPAVNAIQAAEIPEGQEYPEQALAFAKQIEGKVSKKGVKLSFTEEVIADSLWDIVGLHVRAAGRAMARLKEQIALSRFKDAATVVFDNDSGSYDDTTGRDITGAFNDTVTWDDVVDMAAVLMAEKHVPTDFILHPLMWSVFLKNSIFHYNSDGTIDVIKLKNKDQLEAIRRTYRETSPILDIANQITSGVGQGHTRFNPAFAPKNFIVDSLTNAFALGAEMGPKAAGRLIQAVAREVASGGFKRSLLFSKLYSEGKFQEIDRLGATDPYMRDLVEYVTLGGRVSYLQGVAAKGALDKLMTEVGRSGVLRTKDQIANFFDIYNDIFELSSRVAAYRTMRQEFLAKGESMEEAQVHAAEYAKNFANFEQVGRWGKNAGALFMFFRPAATGAVRAIDALRPAFGFNEETFRREAANEGRSTEQIDKAVAKMREETRNARVMSATLVGFGVTMYLMAAMMSGDDEEGRNKTATDDMARWTRYARFHIPGTDTIIQMPWAFGLGAFSAAAVLAHQPD